MAQKLGLKNETFLNYEGNDVGLIVETELDRDELAVKLKTLFPDTYCCIPTDPSKPKRIAVLLAVVPAPCLLLTTHNVDTLITGELKQTISMKLRN